jgi:hypothetical protein
MKRLCIEQIKKISCTVMEIQNLCDVITKDMEPLDLCDNEIKNLVSEISRRLGNLDETIHDLSAYSKLN